MPGEDTQGGTDAETDPAQARGVALDRALALEGEGPVYATTLSREWEIWGPNGGYLAALALRAAGLGAEIGRPASFYCHFLRSPSSPRSSSRSPCCGGAGARSRCRSA